jgi:DNA-binding MurR/RpiR family transcriptional regulator
MQDAGIDKLITDQFESLSPQLRLAARFAIDNPDEIAVNSMRNVAAKAGVRPSTMLRLARQLGFAGYDELRDLFRERVKAGAGSTWSGRARDLRKRGPSSSGHALIDRLIADEHDNLQKTFDAETAKSLRQACQIIRSSRLVYVLGLRSLFPVAFYFHYVCRMFMGKTVLLTGTGGTFADDLRRVEKADTVVAFSYHPYARDSVKAVTFAQKKGAKIIAVTDSRVSPIITPAKVGIVVSNTTPSLFPTILPAFAVAQALAALLIQESGEETMANLARTESQLAAFGVYFDSEK